jgi:hypothetical protein
MAHAPAHTHTHTRLLEHTIEWPLPVKTGLLGWMTHGRTSCPTRPRPLSLIGEGSDPCSSKARLEHSHLSPACMFGMHVATTGPAVGSSKHEMHRVTGTLPTYRVGHCYRIAPSRAPSLSVIGHGPTLALAPNLTTTLNQPNLNGSNGPLP